jgi:hypothetical protein
MASEKKAAVIEAETKDQADECCEPECGPTTCAPTGVAVEAKVDQAKVEEEPKEASSGCGPSTRG